ncbi:MAG: (Fe-S)-binding protein [Promethearchaeota archaeon]
MDKIYTSDLRELLEKCYQCARCSGVCQLSKVEKFTPSRIIQMILEGFEGKVLESGVLWDCLTCNQCLKDCPENINFADLVRMARYKMRHEYNQKPEEIVAHKSIYTTITEIMARPYIQPARSMEWVPKECKIADKGEILYFVGCLSFFNYEFDNKDSIATSTLKLLCQIEDQPIVVFKDEICCGHDIYWGQGKLKTFIKLARRNLEMFERASVRLIITACAECYRTLKIDYAQLFEDFNQKFEVKHLIEYLYENWKAGKIKFKQPIEENKVIPFTYHDPCRLSRFLPKENMITEQVREIFGEFKNLGYEFHEMEHNKANSLCCGVSCWLNCNEKSKALRYKRMLEAKNAGEILVTSCPKCNIHLNCLRDDFESLQSLEIKDFSEFLINHVEIEK